MISTSLANKNEAFMNVLSNILSKDTQILSKTGGIERKIDAEKNLEKEKKQQSRERRLLLDKDHQLPDTYHPEQEKKLRKVATRGVVKLFNAFQTQQQSVKKMGKGKKRGLVKKEQEVKVAKSAFLEYLNSSKNNINNDEHASALNENVDAAAAPKATKAKTAWLDGDFLMNPDLKDWDKVDE